MASYNDRVLVVDDDPEILRIFKSVLQPQQSNGESNPLTALLKPTSPEESEQHPRCFKVDTAQQGEEGFRMVQNAIDKGLPYSVMFTDMRMPPGWDGVKTAQEVRKIDNSIGIVVVTAYSDASVSEIVSKVGFTDRLLYLKKPFDEEEILQLADSLSMRWNLEEKVKGMVKVLESMVDSFFKLRTAVYQENDLEPFMKRTLEQISAFLDTPDVFLARIQGDEVILKIGLGKFSNGLSKNDEFRQLLNETAREQPISTVLRLKHYVVLPINIQKCQDVVVGLINVHEIEGTDRLLEVLARDMVKLYDAANVMDSLRKELDEYKQRIAELEQRR
jgi:CheY-like chemotaxis protein